MSEAPPPVVLDIIAKRFTEAMDEMGIAGIPPATVIAGVELALARLWAAAGTKH